jgi:hypothetical protein
MLRIDIIFDAHDVSDMNNLVTLIRDKMSIALAEQSICSTLAITPTKMTLQEKINCAYDIENNDIMVYSNIFIGSEGKGHSFIVESAKLSDLIKSATIHEVFGLEQLAKQMRQRFAELFIETLMVDVRRKADAKKVISEDRRKARVGKTNRHKEIVLKIAEDTWSAYPYASAAGVKEEIHAYLRGKWKDCPVVDTVKLWIRESGLDPKIKPKNRDFKLVINE